MKLTLSGLELLGLLGAADTSVEAAEGDALLLLNNVAEVSVSLLELHAVDGGGGLASVLEVNTEVLAARLGGLLRELRVVESVSDLLVEQKVGVDGKHMDEMAQNLGGVMYRDDERAREHEVCNKVRRQGHWMLLLVV